MPPPGIELVSVGVGMGNYNDTLLEQLADQGDGFYAYVNDRAEAHHLFIDDLVSTLQTVALDAKVQVEFDPDLVDDLPAHRLREPGHRRQRVPRSGGRCRAPSGLAMRSRPCTTSRSAMASRGRAARDGPAPLDRTRTPRHESVAPDRHPGRRPGAAIRGDRSDLPARRDRGGRGRGAAPGRRLGRSRTSAPSSTSPARAADLPATDQVHDFLRVPRADARARRLAAGSSRQAGPLVARPFDSGRLALRRIGGRAAVRSAAPAGRRPARPGDRPARRPGRDR